MLSRTIHTPFQAVACDLLVLLPLLHRMDAFGSRLLHVDTSTSQMVHSARKIQQRVTCARGRMHVCAWALVFSTLLLISGGFFGMHSAELRSFLIPVPVAGSD